MLDGVAVADALGDETGDTLGDAVGDADGDALGVGLPVVAGPGVVVAVGRAARSLDTSRSASMWTSRSALASQGMSGSAQWRRFRPAWLLMNAFSNSALVR